MIKQGDRIRLPKGIEFELDGKLFPLARGKTVSINHIFKGIAYFNSGGSVSMSELIKRGVVEWRRDACFITEKGMPKK